MSTQHSFSATITCTAKRCDGTENSDTITGRIQDDVIYGKGGDDTINSDIGTDVVFGNDGDDTLSVKSNTINMIRYKNYLDGGNGKDYLYGANGDDSLFAGNGNDSLYGFEGTDTLVGNEGYDTLSGGSGDDTFIIYPDQDTTNNSGAKQVVFDTIKDYNHQGEQDIIWLKSYVYNTSQPIKRETRLDLVVSLKIPNYGGLLLSPKYDPSVAITKRYTAVGTIKFKDKNGFIWTQQ